MVDRGCCSSASSAQVAIWKKKIHKHEALLNETPMGEASGARARDAWPHDARTHRSRKYGAHLTSLNGARCSRSRELEIEAQTLLVVGNEKPAYASRRTPHHHGAGWANMPGDGPSKDRLHQLYVGVAILNLGLLERLPIVWQLLSHTVRLQLERQP